MSEIKDLKPAAIWRNFDALTQVPRPSGHLEKVQQFLLDFAKRVGVEAFKDAGNNIVMRKPATPGMENRKNDFQRGPVLFRMHSGRNSSSVILYTNGVIFGYRDFDMITIAGHSLIYTIVNYLIYKMMKTAHTDVSNIH